MVPLRCGTKEEAEEGEDADGGDDEEDEAAICDARLCGHGGLSAGVKEGVKKRSRKLPSSSRSAHVICF